MKNVCKEGKEIHATSRTRAGVPVPERKKSREVKGVELLGVLRGAGRKRESARLKCNEENSERNIKGVPRNPTLMASRKATTRLSRTWGGKANRVNIRRGKATLPKKIMTSSTSRTSGGTGHRDNSLEVPAAGERSPVRSRRGEG